MQSIATFSRCCSLWLIEPCKVIWLNVKGEITFYIPSGSSLFSCNPTPCYEQNCVVNVATNCGDILTPLHLQAGLHYSRVTQGWCCTWSSLLPWCLLVYKKAQTWLIREPCNYTTMAKVYLHTSAVKPGAKIYTCIPVYCTLLFCTAF